MQDPLAVERGSVRAGSEWTRALRRIDWRRQAAIIAGIILFCVVYWSPPWADAVDPAGKHFELTHQGKAALALFLLIGVWWVFEVVPIGITGLAIGVIQSLFLIRSAEDALRDFMDPSVWFIFGSLTIGMVFSKTGLTRRLAYRMLVMVGERTNRILLGTYLMTGALTLIMAHTAVAAAVFPLLMTIYPLYAEDQRPTRFGKALFMGMAYAAGAGSIITLLGAARGAVAIGFYRDFVGREIGFLELTHYMAPVGVVMILLIWVYFAVAVRPERSEIPGLRERAGELYAKLGPLTRRELVTLVVVGSVLLALALRSSVPALEPLNKSAIILVATLLLFFFRILTVQDLEALPWNIILLFGGAMSIGFCLWHTGAASWLAIKWLVILQSAPALIFVLGIAFFVLVMTNFIMNVAAIAISLPVALVMAPYLGVAPEVVFYSALVTAGMPFLLLIGAAPNAIAYESRQFTSGEFFLAGLPMSLVLMVVLALFVWKIWPWMGMAVRVAG